MCIYKCVYNLKHHLKSLSKICKMYHVYSRLVRIHQSIIFFLSLYINVINPNSQLLSITTTHFKKTYSFTYFISCAAYWETIRPRVAKLHWCQVQRSFWLGMVTLLTLIVLTFMFLILQIFNVIFFCRVNASSSGSIVLIWLASLGIIS